MSLSQVIHQRLLRLANSRSQTGSEEEISAPRITASRKRHKTRCTRKATNRWKRGPKTLAPDSGYIAVRTSQHCPKRTQWAAQAMHFYTVDSSVAGRSLPTIVTYPVTHRKYPRFGRARIDSRAHPAIHQPGYLCLHDLRVRLSDAHQSRNPLQRSDSATG
jgi:hypothetical protein